MSASAAGCHDASDAVVMRTRMLTAGLEANLEGVSAGLNKRF